MREGQARTRVTDFGGFASSGRAGRQTRPRRRSAGTASSPDVSPEGSADFSPDVSLDGSPDFSPDFSLDGSLDLSFNQPLVGAESFEDLARAISPLVPRQEDRPGLLRADAAIMLDSLLVRVVRGQGAVDLALGRDLHALSRRKLLRRLGYTRLGDYARERLGIPEGTARELVRLANGLESLPALRNAVWSGEVEASKALAVLPVVNEENELDWLRSARTKTVRELRAEVKAARGGQEPEEEARAVKEVVSVMMSKEDQATLREALDVAREIEGATAPTWVLLEALAAEFIGSVAPVLVDEGGAQMSGNGEVGAQMSGSGEDGAQMSGNGEGRASGDGEAGAQMSGNGASGPQMSGNAVAGATPKPERRDAGLRIYPLPKPWIDECTAWLKEWTEGWSFLDQRIPTVPGVELPDESSALTLDERLRKLSRMRDGWGELTGRLALLIKFHRLWRDMQFVSFRHYCNDRLFSSARAIEQRAYLERRLFELPGLREAMLEGRISYAKAVFLAGTSTVSSIEERIRWAEEHTCKELRIAHEDEKEEAKREELESGKKSSKTEVDFKVPEVTVDMLCDAVFAAKVIWKESGLGWLESGQALGIIAEHFLGVWRGRTGAPRGKRKRILGRHRGYCSVPTCTLPAEETHHLQFRSQGGGDEEENLSGFCGSHHQDNHQGRISVTGRAGTRLVFKLGIQNGIPLEVFVRKE